MRLAINFVIKKPPAELAFIAELSSTLFVFHIFASRMSQLNMFMKVFL
jgi:hypothetical protein